MSIKQHSKIISITILMLFSFIFTTALGQSIPPRPNPPQLVNDFANILTLKERSALEQKLVRFNDTTSNQITIVTVRSFDGYTPSMFAFEIGEKWQVGQKKFDNGIVIVVKPKLSSVDKGRAFIAIGYGLEPAIPDAIAKRIVNQEMIPYFRRDNYYQGINNATSVLMQLAAGEISSDEYQNQTKASDLLSLLPIIIIIIVVLLMRSNRGRSHTMGSSSSLWTALWLGSMLGSSGSNSGSWNSFSGGGSGFGGGGFGGFGGGSFGGGGAGGSW